MAGSFENMQTQLAKRIEKAVTLYEGDNPVDRDMTEGIVMERDRLEDVKSVSFTGEFRDDNVFTPSRRPHDSAIKKQWLKCLRENAFEQLKEYINLCELKGVTAGSFLLRQGTVILDSVIVSLPDPKPFIFVCANVPNDVLKEVIRKNDYFILRNFISGQSAMDQYRYTDETQQAWRVEKFKLLLNIDPRGVQAFMRENSSEDWVSDGVRSSFGVALQACAYSPK